MKTRMLLVVATLAAACGPRTPGRAALRCVSDADCTPGDSCRAGFCPRGAELSGPPDSSKSTLVITAPSPLPASGASNAAIAVTLKDARGVAVAGQAVTIAASGSNNAFTPPSRSATTNGSGVARFYLSTTRAETKAVTATAGALALTGSLTFTNTALAAPPTTFSASQATVVADGSSTTSLTTTVLDRYGNPAANYPLTYTSTGTGNLFLPSASGRTDANGVFTATLSSTVLGARTVHSALGLTQAVTFVAGPALAPLLTASRASIYADGISASTLTATVKDASGHPLAGQAVSFSAPAIGTLSAPACTTGSSGACSVTVSSIYLLGAAAITASGSGGSGATVSVTFTASGIVSQALTTLAASPAWAPADGTSAIALTATVRDTTNQLMTGYPVQLISSGANTTLGTVNGATDAAGQFSATNASNRPQTVNMQAFAGAWHAVSGLFTAISPASAPAAPVGLIATGGCTGPVALKWNPSTNATWYHVKRSATSGGPYATIYNPQWIGQLDTTAAASTGYSYVVTASNAAGASPPSAEATVACGPPGLPFGARKLVNLTRARGGSPDFDLLRGAGTAGAWGGSGATAGDAVFDERATIGDLYFFDNNPGAGSLRDELWQLNALTGETQMVANVLPGQGSNPRSFHVFQGKLIYQAQRGDGEGARAPELFVYDPSAPARVNLNVSSNCTVLSCDGQRAFCGSNNTPTNPCYVGTSLGLIDTFGAVFSVDEGQTTGANGVYFKAPPFTQATAQLFVTDGSRAGTRQVTQEFLFPGQHCGLADLAMGAGQILYFTEVTCNQGPRKLMAFATLLPPASDNGSYTDCALGTSNPCFVFSSGSQVLNDTPLGVLSDGRLLTAPVDPASGLNALFLSDGTDPGTAQIQPGQANGYSSLSSPLFEGAPGVYQLSGYFAPQATPGTLDPRFTQAFGPGIVIFDSHRSAAGPIDFCGSGGNPCLPLDDSGAVLTTIAQASNATQPEAVPARRMVGLAGVNYLVAADASGATALYQLGGSRLTRVAPGVGPDDPATSLGPTPGSLAATSRFLYLLAPNLAGDTAVLWRMDSSHAFTALLHFALGTETNVRGFDRESPILQQANRRDRIYVSGTLSGDAGPSTIVFDDSARP